MPDYHAAFRVSEYVRVADADRLRELQSVWGEHHLPPTEEQMTYSSSRCYIALSGFEHGGAPLYRLFAEHPGPHIAPVNLPGEWHEEWLEDIVIAEEAMTLQTAAEVYRVDAEIRNQQQVVVIRTINGVECLVKRCHYSQQMATDMNEVARVRNVSGFEARYDFDGIAHDERLRKIENRR